MTAPKETAVPFDVSAFIENSQDRAALRAWGLGREFFDRSDRYASPCRASVLEILAITQNPHVWTLLSCFQTDPTKLNPSYDNLNRVLTAQSSATGGADCWGLTFGSTSGVADDALGNLTNSTVSKCSAWSLSVGVNAYNQITTPSGYSYDAAGNTTADATYTYSFDAESRIITASGMSGGPYCYTYDGNGVRVAKSNANGGSCTGSPTVDVLYWRAPSGDAIAETDGTGSTSNSNYHEYVFFAGRRIARSDPSSGNVYYYFADHIGSTRSVTQANGTVCFSADYYPYGEEVDYTTSCPQNYKFTGYERDAETGLDYAFKPPLQLPHGALHVG